MTAPVFVGFSVSASWGEDDNWAISARYVGEWHDFKVAAAVAYNASTDENGPGSLLIQHNQLAARPSRRALTSSTSRRVCGFTAPMARSSSTLWLMVLGSILPFVHSPGDASDKPEGNQWYVKAGIRQRWLPLGHTFFYGEYGQNNDRMSSQAFLAGVTNTELRHTASALFRKSTRPQCRSGWAGAIIMPMRLATPQADSACDGLRYDGLVSGHNNLNSMDIIKGGALINF